MSSIPLTGERRGSPLLDCPPEVRQSIYESLCPHQITLKTRMQPTSYDGKLNRTSHVTIWTVPEDVFETLEDLLLTNRQLHDEIHTYISTVRIHWQSAENMAFLPDIPSWAQKQIITIEFSRLESPLHKKMGPDSQSGRPDVLDAYPFRLFPRLQTITLMTQVDLLTPTHDFGDHLSLLILAALDSGVNTDIKLPDDHAVYFLSPRSPFRGLMHTSQVDRAALVSSEVQAIQTDLVRSVTTRGVTLEYACWVRYTPGLDPDSRWYDYSSRRGMDRERVLAKGILQIRHDGIWLSRLRDVRGTGEGPDETD